MRLVKMNNFPWSAFDKIFMLDDFWDDLKPSNIKLKNYEVIYTNDEIKVKANLAGVDPKDIKVEVDNNYLLVETGNKDMDFKAPIAAEVDTDKIVAESKHGLLEVTVPLKKKSSNKKVTVQVK